MKIYLFEVDGGLPEVGALEVEISHTNLTEVTGVVLVEVGSVMVLSHSSAFPLISQWKSPSYLTTGHTTTTGVLPVLSNTTMTGGDVTTVLPRLGESSRHSGVCCRCGLSTWC